MQLKKICLGVAVALSTFMLPVLTYGLAYAEVTIDTLNVRSTPSKTAKIVTQLDKMDTLKVTKETEGGWLEVVLEDESKGYVSGQFMKITKATGQINNNAVRLRDYPSTSKGKVLETLLKGKDMAIEYAVDDWYKVSNEAYEGFVHKDLVTPSKYVSKVKIKPLDQVKRVVPVKEAPPVQKTASSKKEQDTPKVKATCDTSMGSEIVADAKQFLGGPYAYGGNSLTRGVDCSGFAQQIMSRHGISISRSSRSQYSGDGYEVSSDNLTQGDLVFYGYDGVVSHVGIYVGNGKIIHANDSSTGIIISNLHNGGKPYIGAKRVI